MPVLGWGDSVLLLRPLDLESLSEDALRMFPPGKPALADSPDHPSLPMGCALPFKALSLFAIIHSVAWAGALEWPQFRGPTGEGASDATNVPVRWDEKQNVKWSVETAGSGWSSPVVSGKRVYMTSAVEEADGSVSLRAMALDETNGATVWSTPVFQPESATAKKMHRKNTAASPTPIVSEGRMYVHFGHLGTAALDLDGKVVWRQEEIRYSPTHGTGGSPVLVGNALVFSVDGNDQTFVVALNAQTGAVLWKTPRETHARKKFSFSTPLAISLDGQTQIISPGSGFVAGYHPENGREIWRVLYGEGYSVVPRPVYAHGLLFLSSGFDAASLLAIRPEGAAGDATQSHVAWTIKKGAPHTPSALVVGDELYFVSDAGIASCVDAKTGDTHWSERLGGNFSASPVLAEGRIYFLNESGTMYVVKAAKNFEMISENSIGDKTLASPAVLDGALLIRSEKRLWKIGS
jgi:outer membrane protein assembly factor BamB